MVTERRRHLLGQQVARRLHVGRDHAFFDQLVRIVAHHHPGLGDFAGVVQHEAHFGGFKFDRTAAGTRLGQHVIQLVQAIHLRHQRTDRLARGRVVLAHRFPDLVVGQARVRVHHCFVEARMDDLAFAVHLHVADKAHAVDLGHQRADAVGQRLRQHRHHEPGEVDRGRALLRFIVQRRTGTHVIGDVGDRHDQAEAFGIGFAVDRVVEVLGVLTIDGDQRRIAQVFAVADLFGCDHHRHGGGFSQHFSRELERQLMAVDGGFHHQRGRQLVAEYGDDAADRRAAGVRRLGQLADHQLAVAGIAGLVGRDLHVALHALVVGHHVVDAELDAEAADQAAHATLEHTRDARLATATTIDAGHVDQHAVAMQHLAHFERRQEQIVATFDRAQEAEPFRVGDHHAGDQVDRLQRRETATAVLHQLAVTAHRAQALAQSIGTVRFGQAEVDGDLFGGLRAIAAVKQLQDRLTAGDRLRIALGLACGEGVDLDLTVERGRMRAAAGRDRPGMRRLGAALVAARRLSGVQGFGHPGWQLAGLLGGSAGLARRTGCLLGRRGLGGFRALGRFLWFHWPPW